MQPQQPIIQIPSTNKQQVFFQLFLADQLTHLYNQKSRSFTEQLKSQLIKDISVFEKELDQPLGLHKKVFAFIAGIKTKHEFLVFRLHSGIWGSVDFYKDNRIVLRIGNNHTILEQQNNNENRKKSQIVVKNNHAAKITFEEGKDSLTFGDFIKIVYHMVPGQGYSQISFNGSHFSEAVMNEAHKQKKKMVSVIRSNIIEDFDVCFQLRKQSKFGSRLF